MDKERQKRGSWGFFLKKVRLNKTVLNLIFISALIFLLIINIISYSQVKSLIDANKWVTHTHDVIQTLDSSLYNIVDVESRQRGYLILGSERYLTDIDFLKATLKKDLDRLLSLTKDNQKQNKRVMHFIDMVEERLSLLNQIMQLKSKNRLTESEGLELLNESQDVSNRVKALGQEIQVIERTLLTERNIVAVKNANASSQILIIGSTISILFLVIAFLLANIELASRRKTESYNQNIQTRLRKIIESASDMIAAFDKDYRFIVFNEAYQREFKRIFERSIAVNMLLDDAFTDLPENKQALIRAWKESLQGHEYIKNMETDGEQEKNIYELSSSLIQNEDNEITGVVHSVRNITKRIQQHTELLESYEKLASGMEELQNKNEQITLLVEMSDIMLACSSQEELSSVMAKYSARLLPFASGYLFIMHPSKNYLEKASTWGNPQPHDITFTPEQCWAIRLGRIHRVNPAHHELVCNHIKEEQKNTSTLLCVPLMAQNDIYGLLYLEMRDPTSDNIDENQRLLLTAFSELTALALANVRLRENLRYQSIRDPLTGLYNRRYLEDFLFKQMHQAERTKATFAILLLDLDHFKKINDTYGHDAGDAALKELGQILQDDIRLGDLAARYGGEEFIVMFYDIDVENAKIRANNLRKEVAKLQIKYGAQQVGHITVSIGVAIFPENGTTSAELIEAADKALYHAKNNGRDQVVLYSDITLKS